MAASLALASPRRPAIPGPASLAWPIAGLALVACAHFYLATYRAINWDEFFHYSQIAELSAEAAHNVGEEVGLPGRVQGWVAKAKELTAE